MFEFSFYSAIMNSSQRNLNPVLLYEQNKWTISQLKISDYFRGFSVAKAASGQSAIIKQIQQIFINPKQLQGKQNGQ